MAKKVQKPLRGKRFTEKELVLGRHRADKILKRQKNTFKKLETAMKNLSYSLEEIRDRFKLLTEATERDRYGRRQKSMFHK